MIKRVTILLACLELARGGTIGNYFSPANTVPSASYLINNAPNNKAKLTPAPIYEEDESSQETKYDSVEGTHGLKSPNNIYANFNTRINNDGAVLTHNFPPIFNQNNSPIAYNPSYKFGSSLTVRTTTTPLNYAPNIPLVAKAYSTPLIKETNELTYNPQTSIIQNEAIKTITTYSNAPAVSHMTFTGLGTNYSW